MKIRCAWAELNDLERDYHDREWGVPVCDDEQQLFEMLSLEGAQAGLSWDLILRRRPAYRQAFHDFAIARVAHMTDEELELVLATSGVVRNRRKVFGVRQNARVILELQKEQSLSDFLWSFVANRPRVNTWTETSQMPPFDETALAMSKALKGRGFTFVGPTICYSLMQAVGMVNDHLVDCFRYQELLAQSQFD